MNARTLEGLCRKAEALDDADCSPRMRSLLIDVCLILVQLGAEAEDRRAGVLK